MPRTLTANLQSDIEAKLTTPRHLVKIVTDVGTLRYSSGEAITFTDLYSAASIHVQAKWRSGRSSCRVTVDDPDQTLTDNLLAADLSAATITVYHTFSGAALAADYHEIYSGSISSVEVDAGRVRIVAEESPFLFPNTFITAGDGFNTLDPSGTYVFPSGTVILRRND